MAEREGMGNGSGGMPGARYSEGVENTNGTEYDTNTDERIQRALAMIRNGAAPSAIAAETGLTRVGNHLEDVETSKTVWRDINGTAGRAEGVSTRREEQGTSETRVSGNDRRGLYSGLHREVGQNESGKGRAEWGGFTDFQQQRITKIITDHAERYGKEEAAAIRREWGDDRAFAEDVYNRYQEGNIFLEQMENYLPETKELAEVLDREFNPGYREQAEREQAEAQNERAPDLRKNTESVNREPGFRGSIAEEESAPAADLRDEAARRNMTDEERKNTRPDIDREDVVFAGDAGEGLYIGRTTDKRQFVKVEKDVLKGVPKDKWRSKICRVVEKLFPKGLEIGNNLINIDHDSKRELTYRILKVHVQ